MPVILKKSDFKTMPWKNGGGVTTEIFQIPSPKNDSFLFRLSEADVASNGPFSIFPNIDRVLILTEGHGLKLTSLDRKIILVQKLKKFEFKGEEAFHCELISGPCKDFNIMTNRNYANSTISFISSSASKVLNFKAECDLKFIYDIANETLYKLENTDQYSLDVQKDSTLIVIDLKKL